MGVPLEFGILNQRKYGNIQLLSAQHNYTTLSLESTFNSIYVK